MQDCHGQQGWKEFHRNRKNILDEFDKLVEQTSNRPVKTAHGLGVEAYIRKWLMEFLPKKYGVTSGYVIPNIYQDTGLIYHFDIIIYDALNSPVLWTEGNEDNSEQGRYRAIPAKHVVSIYEVKSRFTLKNVRDSLEKLGQTSAFSDQFGTNFNCGVIFVDLKESENTSESILKELHKGKDVFGFAGGMVLRYEGDHSCTGNISLMGIERDGDNSNQHLTPLAKSIDDLNIYQKEDGSVCIAERGGGGMVVKTSNNTWSISKSYGVSYDEGGISTCLSWSRNNFSKFCMDLLARLDGLAYNDTNRPSFGMIFDSFRLERAPLQPSEPRENYPYITLGLFAGGSNGERLVIGREGGGVSIEYWIEIRNEGYVDAEASEDMFKNRHTIPSRKIVAAPKKMILKPKDESRSIDEFLKEEGIKIPFRLVYKAGPEGKELYAVEKTVNIRGSEISLL